MESDRHYGRLVANTKVLFYLLDCGNRVLLRLSDTLAQLDHQFSLNEIFTLCQMLSPRQCNLCICMVSARSFHWCIMLYFCLLTEGEQWIRAIIKKSLQVFSSHPLLFYFIPYLVCLRV